MKKNILKLLSMCLVLCSVLIVFTACSSDNGGNNNDDNQILPPTHTCEFTKQKIEDKYKKLNATCERKAIYYYSCECGEKGEETFEYGELTDHVYDKRIRWNAYLESEATCEKGATYYFLCECGKKGTETYEYGEIVDHSYENGICIWCKKQKVSKGLNYKLVEDGTYEVSIGTCADTEIFIPTVHNDKLVTRIADGAFLTGYWESINIPESIMFIGHNAFRLILGAQIKVAEDNAKFKLIDGNLYSKDGKTLIKHIPKETETTFVIPNDVSIIREYALYDSGLTNIEIPNGVTSIGAHALPHHESFAHNVKNGLSYLGNNTNKYLYLCRAENKNITDATIENGCKFIGDYAFHLCGKLTSIEIPNSVTSIGDFAFDGCRSLTSVMIPNSVTSIGGFAFAGCESLEAIEIPNSVTSIGHSAFAGCESLYSIEIPESVTRIGAWAFSGESIISITFKDTSSWYVVGNSYYDWEMNVCLFSIDVTNSSENINLFLSLNLSFVKI